MKHLVIGISTGSHDVETWHFDDADLCQKFCVNLARETGRTVYVIDGKVVGSYKIEIPVKFTDAQKLL